MLSPRLELRGERRLEAEVVVLRAVYGADVDAEVARPREELAADVALVLLEAGVCLQVALQLALSDEALPALLADEGLLLRVGEAVQL